jgi:hypothetical protein
MQNKPCGFVLGTLIHVPGGTRYIETIRPGDLILSSASGFDSKVTPRQVLDVQTSPSVEIWNFSVQSLRVEKSGSEEDYVLLSRHQRLGVMGKRDFQASYDSGYLRIRPLPDHGDTSLYLHPGDEWFFARDLYDSAGFVLCTFDNVGVEVLASHALFTMQNPDCAWGSHSIEEILGSVYDLSGNCPRSLGYAENDLSTDKIPPEDINSCEMYPYFRRTVYSLSVEGENSYFVGKLGFLVQGFVED